jgi:predicted MFS family arabinose efflux permease
VFVALAVMNMTMLFGVIVLVDESLPEDRRSPGGLKTLPASMRDMRCNRHYAGYVMTIACTTSAMFGYTSASPFVLQNIIVVTRTPSLVPVHLPWPPTAPSLRPPSTNPTAPDVLSPCRQAWRWPRYFA